MARYIYNRCSTKEQDFKQQMFCVTSYLERNGISMDSIDGVVTEKISGGVEHTERKLKDLLGICNDGDIIYVSELSRLSRSLIDSLEIFKYCGEHNITVICCGENKTVNPDSIEFIISMWFAEAERKRLQFRVQCGMDALKKDIKEKGGRIARSSGKWITHIGRLKGEAFNYNTAPAYKAWSTQQRAKRLKSAGYKWCVEKYAEGWTMRQILEEFNKMHDMGLSDFKAPNGGRMSYPTLKRWLTE